MSANFGFRVSDPSLFLKVGNLTGKLKTCRVCSACINAVMNFIFFKLLGFAEVGRAENWTPAL